MVVMVDIMIMDMVDIMVMDMGIVQHMEVVVEVMEEKKKEFY